MYNLTNIQLPSSMEAQESYFTIVGFALNGPVNVPFMIRDNVSPYEVLGVCPLADAYIVAKGKGIRPLVLRLNGSHASTGISLPTGGEPVATLTSIEARTACNDINITVYPTHIRVTGVTRLERFYVYSDYPTLGKLKEAINSDAQYGVGEIRMETENDMLPCTSLTTIAYDIWLQDGDSGATYISRFDGSDTNEAFDMQKNLIKESLLEEYEESGSMTYSHVGELAPFNVDTIVVPDIPYENSIREPYDEHQSIAEIMGKYCESKSKEQDSFCSCVLGSMLFAEVDSEDNPHSAIVQRLQNIGASSNDTYFAHVEVVIGVEEEVNRGIKIPVAVSFASSRHLLPMHISATNKEINNISTLFSRIRKEHIASLAGSGYTCIIPSIRRGYVAHKSIAFVADKNLITSKPHFSRASRYHTNQIVNSLDSFIGESASNLKLVAMEQLLRAETEELKSQDIYKDIEYAIQPSGTNMIKVTLTFVIYGEIEAIHTSASYNPIRKTVIEWT